MPGLLTLNGPHRLHTTMKTLCSVLHNHAASIFIQSSIESWLRQSPQGVKQPMLRSDHPSHLPPRMRSSGQLSEAARTLDSRCELCEYCIVCWPSAVRLDLEHRLDVGCCHIIADHIMLLSILQGEPQWLKHCSRPSETMAVQTVRTPELTQHSRARRLSCRGLQVSKIFHKTSICCLILSHHVPCFNLLTHLQTT